MRYTFATLALVLLCSPAQSQAFNCNFAKTPDEITICRDDSLKALDEEMSDLYFSVRRQMNEEGQGSMNRLQKQFLTDRGFCGTDGNCIAEAYEKQKVEICITAGENGIACP
jgi:uncharacterized protein